MFVGRFVEKMGIKYLIEAAAKLREAELHFELVLIGNGSLESALNDAASKARIPCRFLFFMPVDEVRDWLGKAAIAANPSVMAADGDSEGLPNTLLEAQAMETPVVATHHSFIPGGVEEDITAELVNERDSLALADKLRFPLESRAKSSSFRSSRSSLHNRAF